MQTKNEILNSLHTLLLTSSSLSGSLKWHDGSGFDNESEVTQTIMLDSNTSYDTDFGISTSAPVEVFVNVEFVVFAKGSTGLATVRSAFETIYSTITSNIDLIYSWNSTLQIRRVDEEISPEMTDVKFTVGKCTLQLKLIEKNL